MASDHWAAHAESVLAARDVAATRCCLSNPSRRTAVCGKRENNDKDIQLDDVDVIVKLAASSLTTHLILWAKTIMTFPIQNVLNIVKMEVTEQSHNSLAPQWLMHAVFPTHMQGSLITYYGFLILKQNIFFLYFFLVRH